MKHPLTLVVHNVRSTHNVGSILRTADCAGVAKVYLCGYTPAPTDRFGRKRADIAKVALGAEDSIVWEHRDTTEEVIKELQQNGVRVVALEQDEHSISYTNIILDRPTALIVGEEVRGIPKNILALCEMSIDIPMQGRKESLNVSVATGIAVFRLIEEHA